ncbi:MAG: MATE family efflux transporter, partial [Duncaniella sp.]|nr:MATE family efflux transporter [Duncaniella sp.]
MTISCPSVNRRIASLAFPAIISNITVPLLGLSDTAITGHLGDASYIAAIAAGGMMLNVVYWLFGFLRMGTTG